MLQGGRVPDLDRAEHGNARVVRVRAHQSLILHDAAVQVDDRPVRLALPLRDPLTGALVVLHDLPVADRIKEPVVDRYALRGLGRVEAPDLLEALRRGWRRFEPRPVRVARQRVTRGADLLALLAGELLRRYGGGNGHHQREQGTEQRDGGSADWDQVVSHLHSATLHIERRTPNVPHQL